MRLRVIACQVFRHEIEFLAPQSPHQLACEFIELGEHAKPQRLREKLLNLIATAPDFDAVVLAYGLCGRAVDGLRPHAAPVVLLRSHDCCGILLGSRKRFEELFSAMPSTPFSSVGYVESGNYYYDGDALVSGDGYAQLVEKYGEEDAKYIYETMHPKLNGKYQPIYFIEHPEIPAAEAKIKCRTAAAAEGREFRELTGDLRLLRKLLNGDWDDAEFLTARAGEVIAQVGDWDRIVKTLPAP
jgi:hypothetical protein